MDERERYTGNVVLSLPSLPDTLDTGQECQIRGGTTLTSCVLAGSSRSKPFSSPVARVCPRAGADEDLAAIYRYLNSVDPVANDVGPMVERIGG